MSKQKPIKGEILGESRRLTLEELCRSCALPREQVLLLVEEGIIEPELKNPKETEPADHDHWRFHWRSLTRVRTSHRLQRDLGINLAGVALAVELLERIEKLERQLSLRGKSVLR